MATRKPLVQVSGQIQQLQSSDSTPISVQANGTALTQRGALDFAGAGQIAEDDATNSRTIVYTVNPAEMTTLGGAL